ncbi:hypothetical protein ASL14_12885 [Paenibacillus sp. IHB B 3084]|uniref:hypothetical protein n=1 Tax=Paenibacillus sp. IHB B 3084 TaxID=867076 RepID=UPI00072009FC|nr:hypothetical protein [Paenibacillus sp. IHB B 3084]ALP36930.1 hypothetical protein ASL14_12885 [Paenibacillus sp. IHB B 3084]
MKFLNKRMTIILLLVLVCTFATISVSQDFKSKEVNLPTIAQHTTSNTISDLLIYDIHYSIKTLDLLGETYNFSELSSKIRQLDVKAYLSGQNSLYNLWLLSEMNKQVNTKPKDINSISDYILNLQSPNGYFPSYSGERINNKLNYLSSTKMVIDICSYYDINPDFERLEQWIQEISLTLSNTGSKEDFLSFGGYTASLKQIDDYYYKKTGKHSVDANVYKNMLDKLKYKYSTMENSIEKYDTALNLEQHFGAKIFKIDKRALQDYMKRAQLQNGSFPMFGNQGEDSLSTFIAINVLKSLQLKIPKELELKSHLKQVLNESLVSIKN